MPLQKGKIDYLFQSGMAGDTDPRIVPVGSFLDIKNAYVDKKGALVKRNGFQRIAMDLFDGSSVSASRGLFSAGDELCLSGARKLYALDDVSGEWNDRGPISPMVGKTDQFFSEDSTIFRNGLDSSTNDGYRLMATSYVAPDAAASPGVTRTYISAVETRIDSDDGNVARESEVLVSGAYATLTNPVGDIKTSFCEDSLLLATHGEPLGGGVNNDYIVYRFDTTNLSAAPTIIRTIPTASMVSTIYRRRPDMCGHTGAVAAGQFSLKYVTNNYDLTVERMDNTGAIISTTVIAGPAAGRWILDASISDDPVNDRTLAIVVYVDLDPDGPESPPVSAMNLRIALCSIDHNAGVLWFQLVDTINVSEDFGYRIDFGGQGNPEAMGVSRGQLKDGTEIVTGVYSIMRDAGTPSAAAAASHSVGFGTNTWQSTNHLWDTDGFQGPLGAPPPPNVNPQGDWGHVDYPSLATGSALNPGRRVPTKWVRTVAVSVDAATGSVTGGTGRPKDIYNCCLDSKPFYNGRSVYAWCSSNLNIAAGYETAFCLDFRQDNSLASEVPDVPPYLVAVKDVGVCQPPRGEFLPSGGTNQTFFPRGAAQSADRDSLGRVLTSSVIVKEALSFRHGELLRDPESGWPDERTAATVTTLSFGDPVSVATLADGASVVGGAMVSWYDTQRCTELSYIAPPVFDHFWSQVNQSTDMTAGAAPWPVPQSASRLPIDMETGLLSVDHLYTYIAIWKTYDSKGYLHRSIFSPSYQAPPINATCVTWPQNNQYWADGGGVTNVRLDCNIMFTKTCVVTNRLAEEKAMTTDAKIYRDFSNNQIFQEVNGKTDVTLNVTTKWWTHFVDYGQDLTTRDPNVGTSSLYSRFTSPGGEVLYTVGGELESVIPSGAKLAVYANDRIWLAGFYHAERLAYSKKVTPQGANLQKIAPEFNEGFVLTTPAGAAITSLASMDDKVVAFTKNSVYVVAGDGPTATGANNTFSALTLVSSDSGCAEPRSTVTFPGGVMYQGDGGIYVLTRGMTTSFIGEGIRDITNQYPVITSAVSVPSKTQVRFTATTADGTSGVIIIFDYRVNQWMYWSVGGAPFVGAALHRGIYFTVEETGQVWREDVSTWKDGADDTYYQMNVKTAWLQAAKQSGWQRVYRATALCENKAPMNMRMTVANDFNATTSQVALWDDAVIATFPEPPRMQPMIHVKRQQCQAVQLEIMDEVPTSGIGATSGEGFTIAGFSLEVGLKRGMVKVSKQQRS
jgi:hypothetical protein